MQFGLKFKTIVTSTVVLLLIILQTDVYSQQSNTKDSLVLTENQRLAGLVTDLKLIKQARNYEHEKLVFYIQQSLNKLGYQVQENNTLDKPTKKAYVDFLKNYGIPTCPIGYQNIELLFKIAAKH